MAKIDEYMKSFSKEIGLEASFKPDFPGLYMFLLEDAKVSVTDKNGEVTLTASFEPVPEKKEAFFTDLLVGDLFYQGTRGSVLGINSEDNKIIVKKVLDHDLSDKEFSEEMEDFLNAVEAWKTRSKEFR